MYVWSMCMYMCMCVYCVYWLMCIYAYRNNLRTSAVSFFESLLVQLRSHEAPEGPESSGYYYRSGHNTSPVATLFNQRNGQLKKVKERYIRSICGQQLFRSLRAHHCSSHQMKLLKDQSAQATTRAVGITHACGYSFQWVGCSVC